MAQHLKTYRPNPSLSTFRAELTRKDDVQLALLGVLLLIIWMASI